MTAPSFSPGLSCARAWQAEAVHDKRLTGADRASFERHAVTCAVCTRELRMLAILDSAFERLPTRSTMPLELRRRRSELLGRANELIVRAPRRRWSTPRYAALVGAVSLVLAIVWIVRISGEREPPAIATAGATPTYRLSTSPRASWRMLEETTTVQLELRDGRFTFEVDKLLSGQRFLLKLPDGELEVKGTRFVVDLADARTRAVSVQEGRVALRINGSEQVLLLRGDVWPPVAAAPVGVEPAPDGAKVRPTSPSSRGAHSGVVATTEAPRGSAPKSAPPASAAPSPSAQSEFAQAMVAFSAGDFARAEALFLAFEQHHPRDGRVEDSTFLRAVARSRRGDAAGAQALAREYLRRYPKGLRRLEAGKLAGNH